MGTNYYFGVKEIPKQYSESRHHIGKNTGTVFASNYNSFEEIYWELNKFPNRCIEDEYGVQYSFNDFQKKVCNKIIPCVAERFSGWS